jgi:hypothetical protein
MDDDDIHYDTQDEEEDNAPENEGPMYGPLTEEQFREMHLGSLIYVYRALVDTARASPSPHLFQDMDFERFCWVAFRTS